MKTSGSDTSRKPMPRRGRWTYGDHGDYVFGWRLADTNLVLDYDPLDRGGALKGAYALFIGGRHMSSIDHYLDGSMEYVEQCLAEKRCIVPGPHRRPCGFCPPCTERAQP